MENKIYFYTKEKLINKLSKLEYITKLLEYNLSNKFNNSKNTIKFSSFKKLYYRYLKLLNLKDAFIKFFALKIELEFYS